MQDILFPVLTGLSLVFAGILVGYYLWFRDRTEQLELCEQLAADNESLAGRLSAKSSNLEELEDQVDRVGSRNEQLRQLCDDLLASREKADAHSRELESELYDARCKLDQAREQLTAECRLRAKSEENLHLTKQQYLDAVSGLEKEWKHKIADSEAIVSRQQSDLQRVTGLYEQTAEKLNETSGNVAELKSELNSQRQLLDIAKNNAVGLEKEYISLESSMRSQIELLNESRGQTASAKSAQKLAESALEESRQQIAELQQQVDEHLPLKTAISDMESNQLSLQQALSNERERVESVCRERDLALAQCQELEESVVCINKRSENQQQTIRGLKKKTQEMETRSIEFLKNIESLNSKLRATEVGSTEQAEENEKLRSELKQFRSESELQRSELESATAELTFLRAELDSERTAHKSTRSDIAVLETEKNSNWEMLQSLRTEFGKTESARFELQEANMALSSRLASIQSDHSQQSQKIESLEAEAGRIEESRLELQNRLVELQSRLREQDDTIRSLHDEREQVKATLGDYQQKNEGLKNQIQQSEIQESELRTECVELTQRVADLERLRLDDQSTLKNVSEENAHLMIRLSEVENAEDAEFVARQATSRLTSVTAQRDKAMEQVRILTSQVAGQRSQIEELQELVRETNFPRLHTDVENRVTEFTKQYGGTARIDTEMGLVFTQAPDVKDDLKRIYGVAQVLEKRLNEFGIYTFRQIMEWDQRAIEEFSDLLTFKDRIHRDSWLEQAKRLHEEKYDRRAA